MCTCSWTARCTPSDDGKDVPRPGRSYPKLPRQGKGRTSGGAGTFAAETSCAAPGPSLLSRARDATLTFCFFFHRDCKVRELEGDLTDVQAKEQESILENVKEERSKVANLNVKVRLELIAG